MFGDPATTVAGNALKFFSSIRIEMSKSVTAANSVVEEGKRVSNLIRYKIIKNKVAPPFENGEFYVRYGVGIDKNKEFTNYCRISHGNNVLNYFGDRIEVIKEIEEVKEIKTDSINLDMEVRGSFSYKGLSMLQHQNVINVFRELLLKIKPKRIIEIGTEYGGLTLLLSDLIKELDLNETIIRSYDIKVPTFLISHSDFNDKIEIITKDLFSYNPFSLKLESITELKEFMCEPGSNIILCDGGNKIGEFNVISDIIGIGDIIMAHDYAKNDEVFVERIQNKIWNWNEIQESDIIDSINKNNLNPFMETEFENVAWVCKIKE
jgi:cephalosporin hydroxylase